MIIGMTLLNGWMYNRPLNWLNAKIVSIVGYKKAELLLILNGLTVDALASVVTLIIVGCRLMIGIVPTVKEKDCQRVNKQWC